MQKQLGISTEIQLPLWSTLWLPCRLLESVIRPASQSLLTYSMNEGANINYLIVSSTRKKGFSLLPVNWFFKALLMFTLLLYRYSAGYFSQCTSVEWLMNKRLVFDRLDICLLLHIRRLWDQLGLFVTRLLGLKRYKCHNNHYHLWNADVQNSWSFTTTMAHS
jgi:hypothetical protein